MLVYDDEGNELGEFSLSEKQQAAFDDSGAVMVTFHIPQLLQSTLGTRSGAFDLLSEDDRVVTTTPDAFKQYLDIRKVVDAARREH